MKRMTCWPISGHVSLRGLAAVIGFAGGLLALTASWTAAEGTPAEEFGPAVLSMSEAGTLLQLTTGHSRLLTGATPLATVIIGNDTIAAATLGTNNSLVVTGLAPGSTNLIVLDESQDLLMAATVEVVPVEGRLRYSVIVQRGISRELVECRRSACVPVAANGPATASIAQAPLAALPPPLQEAALTN